MSLGKSITGRCWKLWFRAQTCKPVRAFMTGICPVWIARRRLRQEVAQRAHLASGWMLDVGCGVQPYRPLFRHVSRYVAVDLPPTKRVDAHADALRLPFADASFDTVLCNQVLEHVPEPARLMAEVQRVLRPGGVLLLTTPQVWGLHHEPYDFFRYTKYGLKHLAQSAGLHAEEIVPTTGLIATFTQRLADAIAYGWAGHWPRPAFFLLSLALWPMLLVGYLLDGLMGRRGDTLDNVLIARKPVRLTTTRENSHARAA